MILLGYLQQIVKYTARHSILPLSLSPFQYAKHVHNIWHTTFISVEAPKRLSVKLSSITIDGREAQMHILLIEREVVWLQAYKKAPPLIAGRG
jgi:hypothetical protein